MAPVNGVPPMKRQCCFAESWAWLIFILADVAKMHLGDSAAIYRDVWIYFNLIGNTILLPLVVLTFIFSKTAKRHPTLVNLCITWIFSGVFSLLLYVFHFTSFQLEVTSRILAPDKPLTRFIYRFYTKQHVGPDPDKLLCVAQASFLYGITPM